jgi:hypothetical protein
VCPFFLLRGQEGEKSGHTFIGLGDVIVAVDFNGFARVLNHESDVLLVIEADVRVADDVHGELELAGLRGRLELHFHGDNFESWGAIFVESGLVESRETERRDGDLALP